MKLRSFQIPEHEEERVRRHLAKTGGSFARLARLALILYLDKCEDGMSRLPQVELAAPAPGTGDDSLTSAI